MQFPAAAKPPVGIVFDTAMNKPGDALALAMLHGFDGKDQARIAAISISSGDLKAAQFCDRVRLFYASATTGPAAMFMHAAPVGLAEVKPDAPTPMFSKMAFDSSVKSMNDTADPATLIRNMLEAQHDRNAAIVLSGPATDLARALDLSGTKDWIERKVRMLCLAEPGIEADGAAARKIFSGWPTPIVTVGREIGDAVPFPAESIERDFAWSPAHPIVEAYRAYKPMPYDAPCCAMAAMLYAVHPDGGYFKASGNSNPRALEFDAAQKDRILQVYIEMASAKPVPRKPRHPVADEKKADEKKKDEKQ